MLFVHTHASTIESCFVSKQLNSQISEVAVLHANSIAGHELFVDVKDSSHGEGFNVE